MNIILTIIITLLACLGLTTLWVYIQYLLSPKVDVTKLQYARLRLEWQSACVTYRTVPYYDDRTLDVSMQLASAMRMREETGNEGKRYVEDKVVAVTVVHKNWPRPADNTSEDTSNA